MSAEDNLVLRIDALDKSFFNEVVTSHLKNELPEELEYGPITKERIDQLLGHDNFNQASREILANVLLEQYQELADAPNAESEVIKNIELLRESNTITVTTGQQIHIFLGPLFVAYKILSCIGQAKKIEKLYPGVNVVPVFWMASEDHDFDEIRSVELYNESYVWERPAAGPVGRLSPESLLELVDKIDNRIDDTPENRKFIDLCRRAYSEHKSFARATQYIVHNLFGQYGLVVLDPDNSELKRQFQDVIRKDVFEQNIQEALDSGIATMKSHGIKAPINTRPINHFFLTENGRNRIEFNNGLYQLVGTDTRFTKDELEIVLNKNPEKFSPNALLRPIFQQTILPNILYIAGANEYIYWLVLHQTFESTATFKPDLEVRTSAFLIGSGVKKMFERYNLELSHVLDTEENFDALLSSISSQNINILDHKSTIIQSSISDIELLVKQLDVSNPTKTFRKSLTQFYSALEEQLIRWREEVIARNEQMTKVKRLKSKIRSTSHLQERNEFILSNIQGVLKLAEYSNTGNWSYYEAPGCLILPIK